MRLVAGLGNPGPEYNGTRHNAGFAVLDRVAGEIGISLRQLDCRALTGRGKIGAEPVLLAKPVTFMNASGEAVTGLLKKHGLELSELLVICDDVDLPVGTIRVKPGGSSGGQKGLKSVEALLGSGEFARLRIGIRGEHYSREEDLSDYVLAKFSRAERPMMDAAEKRAAAAVQIWVEKGITETMNRFNAVPESTGP